MILYVIFFTMTAFSQVIQDEVSSVEKSEFSFKEVCSKMVTHETPLIEIVTGNQLDCMGKKIEVGDFCDKEMATDPYYLRGYISKKDKKVICKSGKKLSFKYNCRPARDQDLCGGSAKANCLYVQKKLARRLDLTEYTMSGKKLSCEFASLPLRHHSVPL